MCVERVLQRAANVCAGRGELSQSIRSKNQSFPVQYWGQIVTQSYCTDSFQAKRMQKGRFWDFAGVEWDGLYQFL